MATIALYAGKINQMPELIKRVQRTVEDYKTELSSLRIKALTINNGVCDLYDVISSIQASTQIQEDKIDSLDTFRQNSENFISDVIRIDGEVEELVRKRKEDFYEKYEYLKPESEKSIWEKIADGCKAVGEWCKEHWEILVVIAVAAVAIIAVVIFFPAAGPILLLAAKGAVIGALKGALFGALTGGLFSGAINWFAGESFWEGFKTGAISGALMGALFGGIGGIGSALAGSCQVVSLLGGVEKVMKAVTYTLKISGGMSSVMDAFDLIVFGASIFYPSSPLVLFAEKLHSSKLYNAFQFTVNAVAAFSGGAYSSLRQGPPACFVAGTMILTASGMVAIEKIKAGDKVISTNPDTFETAEKTVLETYIREVPQLMHLTINKELITTTVDHPFYVKNRGFINARGIQVGDKVVNAAGDTFSVENIYVEIIEKSEMVYNFQVEDFHTYHVGNTGVWVHNASYEDGTPTQGYSDFADGMSQEDAARYIANNEKAFFNAFSERASAAGLNDAQISEAFEAMRSGDYAKMASYFDTSSPVEGAVFWSGNKEGAATYANSIGGTIMEQTPGGQVFDNWRELSGMYPEWDTRTNLDQKLIWDALSSQYANGAEGMATYVHPSGYEGKVWSNIEKPILEANDIIIQEVIIDAK